MAVAFDASSAANSGTGSGWTSPITFSGLITPTASATGLTIGIAMNAASGTNPLVTGITWGGVSMSNLGTITASDASSATTMFALANPVTGSGAQAVVSTSGVTTNAAFYIMAVSWKGTDTSSTANAFPIANVVTNASTPAGSVYPTGSFTVTTASGDMVYGVADNRDGFGWGGVTAGTLNTKNEVIFGNASDGYNPAAGASTTLQFSSGPSNVSTGIAIRIAQPTQTDVSVGMTRIFRLRRLGWICLGFIDFVNKIPNMQFKIPIEYRKNFRFLC